MVELQLANATLAAQVGGHTWGLPCLLNPTRCCAACTYTGVFIVAILTWTMDLASTTAAGCAGCAGCLQGRVCQERMCAASSQATAHSHRNSQLRMTCIAGTCLLRHLLQVTGTRQHAPAPIATPTGLSPYSPCTAHTTTPLLPPQVRVTAVGHGSPDDLHIPAAIASSVHLHTLVPYKEFYTYLCQSRALLTLFSASGR